MGIGPVRDAFTPVQTSRDTFTYERFFGLREKPFSLASDPRFLYPSRSHAIAFDELLAGIRRREGLLVLTGDIGTGKTTLCRAVLRTLDRKTFSAFVPDPFASREDLLKMLLIEFGVMSIQDLATGHLKNASRTELNYLLSGFLDSLAPLEAFVVMIIDEAQNMALPLIEEIRILSDTFGQKGQLQVVFVGQLELHEKLKLPEMRQVDQRVCVYCKLDPLTPEAVMAYIQHRVEVAGGSHDRVMFAPDVFELLHRSSAGVPRVINRICDRALHLAYLKHAAMVDRSILEGALIDVGQTVPAPIEVATPAKPSAAAEPPLPAETQTPAEPERLLALQATQAPEAPQAGQAPPSNKFATSVDEWLTRTEADPSIAAAPPLDVFPVDAPVQPPDRKATIEPPGMFTTSTGWRDRDGRLRNQTYMQRLARRWLRRVIMWAVVVLLSYAGFTAVTHFSTDWLSEQVEPPTVSPAPAPRIPAVEPKTVPPEHPPSLARSGEFHIAVGLFTTDERAGRLVIELTAAGLPAYQRAVKLGRERVLRQVLLGPYLARADAQTDLDKLKQMPGYDDAKVIEIAVTGTRAGE